ncbi:MAG: hypothetical protein Q9181_003337 [Wetmoreana brouardii]
MVERLAFGKCGNDYCSKGDGQEPSDEFQTMYSGVVGAPDHDHMNKCHPAQERDYAQCHNLVLSEEPLGAYVSATDAN